MALEGDLDALKRVHDSVNIRVVALEEENGRLKQMNEVLVAEKKQWEQQKEMQTNIIKQQLDSSDEKCRVLEAEIATLRGRLKNGDNDRLVN